MTTSTPAVLRKLANLQMVAEARMDLFSDLRNALAHGNNRTSRFTSAQVDQFIADGWTVVAHLPRTSAGFSGTLFRNTNTHERILSFPCTESINDVARDNQGTRETKPFARALGQIADMEMWFKTLSLKYGDRVTVTGCGEGGRLATTFNMLRPGFAEAIHTFDGVGISEEKIGGESTPDTIGRWRSHHAANDRSTGSGE